jgi:hypothetical protein
VPVLLLLLLLLLFSFLCFTLFSSLFSFALRFCLLFCIASLCVVPSPLLCFWCFFSLFSLRLLVYALFRALSPGSPVLWWRPRRLFERRCARRLLFSALGERLSVLLLCFATLVGSTCRERSVACPELS